MTRILEYLVIPGLLSFLFFDPAYCMGVLLPWDEGQHLACIGSLMAGKVLYRDIYDISAPLPEFIPYLMMKISSVDVKVLRTFYYFGTLLSLFTMYFAGLRIIKSRAALLFAVLLCAGFSIFGFWSSRWGGFRIGSAYLALLLLWAYIDSRRPVWLFASGVGAAFALLFSQEMGIAVILIAGILFLMEVTASRQQMLIEVRKFSLFLLGFAIGFAPWIIYSMATDSLAQYLRISFIDIPFKLTSALPYGRELMPMPATFSLTDWYRFWTSKTGGFLLVWLILAVQAAVLAVSGWRGMWGTTQMKRLTLFLFGLYLVILAARCIDPGAPQLNYALSPVLILLVSQIEAGMNYLSNKSPCSRRDILNRLFIPGTFIFLSMLVFLHMARLNQHKPYQLISTRCLLTDDGVLDLPRAKQVKMPADEAAALQEISTFIMTRTNPSDPLFTFPFDGRYYFLTNRRNPSRFDIAINTALRPEYEQEAIRDLEQSTPPYVIYNRDVFRVGGENSIPNEERTPLLTQYLLSRYIPIFERNGTVVMKRVDYRGEGVSD